jgi:hypothetical protein
MDVRPWSKSFHVNMKKCAWKAYNIKKKKIKEPPSEPAEQGKESHEFWQKILDGQMIFSEIGGAAKYPLTRSLVRKALDMEEIGTGGIQFFEPHYILDAKGLITSDYDSGLFHGYLDRVVLFDGIIRPESPTPDMSNGTVYVEDLKTGVSTQDDPTERHGYIALVKCKYPECRKFRFARLFCKKGVRHKWDYTFSDDSKSVEIFNHQKQTTETFRITARSKVAGLPGANPLFNYLYKMDEEILNAVVVPNPGKHCENWYGSPCFCLGRECPLAKDTPMIAAEMDKQLEAAPDIKTLLLKLLNMNHPSILQKWEVETGFSGVIQLEGFVKKIKNNIKVWSKRYGPIRLGDTNYGWDECVTSVIDSEKALTAMVLGDMDIKDIARTINISESSLSKAPKGYAGIIDRILQESLATKKTVRFGPLPENTAEVSNNGD